MSSFWMPNVSLIQKQLEEAKKREEEAKNRRKDGSIKRDLKTAMIRVSDLEVGEHQFRLTPTWRTPDHPDYEQLPFLEIEEYAMVPPDLVRVRNLRKTYPRIMQDRGLVDHVSVALDRLFKEKYVKSWADFGAYPNQEPYRDFNGYVGVLNLSDDVLDGKILQLKKNAYSELKAAAIRQLNRGRNIFDLQDGRICIMSKRIVDGKSKCSFEFEEGDPVADNDEDLQRIVASIWNLDRIFGFPKDEKLEEYERLAEAMYNHFVAKFTAEAETDLPEDAPKASKKASATGKGRARKNKGHAEESPQGIDDLPLDSELADVPF